jgi:Flp pilus assembly protein TadD
MAQTDETAEPKLLIAERRYGDAIVVCRQLLLAGKTSPELRILLAQALLAEERFDDVRVEMASLVRAHPEQAEAHRLLGEAFLRTGQKDKAEEALHRALSLSPDDETARELLEEAAGEKFPVAQTIERWFGQEEGRTVETELPAFEEEHTPVPRPASASVQMVIEPSIQIDPSLAEEAERLREERRERKAALAQVGPDAGAFVLPPPQDHPPLDHPAETADTTMPGSPPARGEGLRAMFERALPPQKSASAPKIQPSAPKPAQKPLVAKPGIAAVAPAAKATDVSASPRGPDGTQVARPLGGKASPIAAPPKRPGSIAPSSRASLPPPPLVSPRVPQAPSSVPPPPPGRPLSRGPTVPVAPAAPVMDVEPATTELSMPELEERMSDEVPAPLAESDESELTRPLPPISASDLDAVRDFRAAADGRRPQPSVPPPRAAPPGSVRPPRDPNLDPRSLPSFGPAAPLKAIASSTAQAATAIVPLPPVSIPQAGLPAGSPMPLAMAPPMVATAPEIALSGAAAKPRLGLDAVPPTSVHAPQGFSTPPARGAAFSLGGLAPIKLDRTKLAIGGGVALVLGLIAIVAVATSGPSALDEAMLVASTDGRPASFDAALLLAPEDGSDQERATRALLLAITTLELGLDRAGDADRVLATLGTESSALAEARIARSLVALSRGQGGQALTVLSGLSATGAVLVEAFRARALALAEVGELSEAVDAARQAATLAPGAPRHAALYAELSVLAGDVSGAQRVLDGSVGIDDSATLRLARAELGILRGGDPAVVRSTVSPDLEAVLGPLVTISTGPELGRARLCRALLGLASGDAAGARSDLELAFTLVPPHDSRRRLALAEAFIQAEAPARGLEVASALTGETSDPAGRAAVVVRAALAAGNLPAAELAVGAAGTGPRIDMLRARIAEAHGNLAEARGLYALAAAEPTLLVDARTAEGRLYLMLGQPREALVALTQALGARPAAPVAVLAFVRAAILTDDIAAAERIVAGANAIDDDAPEILAATALTASARGRFDVAYGALERAVAARPEDAELKVDLGDAALSLGRLDDAGRAYDAAAALPGAPPRVFLRLASLAMERGDLAGAQAHLDHGSAAPELERAQVRARLLVALGAGRSGVDEVTRLRSGRASDRIINLALATLYVQAEEDRAARRPLLTALRGDRENPEALVLSALIDAHEGRSSGARSSLDTAERSAASRGTPPSVRARLLAVRGRLAFDGADATEARARADEALRIDPHCAEAHLLIADLEIEGARDPVPALRSAVTGTGPLGEAFGRLALRLGSGDEACTLGRRYLETAPGGYDARSVRDLVDACP